MWGTKELVTIGMKATGRPRFAGIAKILGRLMVGGGYAGIEAGIDASEKAGVGNWLGWRLCLHSDAQNGTGATFRGRQVLSDMQVKTG